MLIQEIWVQVSEELMKLRKEQEEMESKLKLRVIGLPLFDTILQVYTKKIHSKWWDGDCSYYNNTCSC